MLIGKLIYYLSETLKTDFAVSISDETSIDI